MKQRFNSLIVFEFPNPPPGLDTARVTDALMSLMRDSGVIERLMIQLGDTLDKFPAPEVAVRLVEEVRL